MTQKTIYKYQIILEDNYTSVWLPDGYKVIHVGEQYGNLFVWVVIDDSRPAMLYDFLVHGTGHPFTGEEGVHVGTAQMSNGLVWHVFERG